MKNETKKSIFGMPMQWDFRNIFKDIWNPEDLRIFPPKRFGIGWGLNFHALARKLNLIKKEPKR